MAGSSKRRTPEEALRIAVEDLGGLQEVGARLRPEIDPILAGQWLAHCLTATKRDKLSLAQVQRIWEWAHAIGAHEGFEAFAASLGYTAVAHTPEAQLAEALKRAEQARAHAEATARDLQTILDNPQLVALMRAAHINVDAASGVQGAGR